MKNYLDRLFKDIHSPFL